MKTFLILFTVFYSFALPIAAAILWKKKQNSAVKPFFVGALVFFVFVLILESLVNQFAITGDHAFARYLASHPFAYGIYGALMAGIFEETGRLIAFRTLLRKNEQKADAAAYGIGHGGMEVIMLLGTTYLIYAVVLFAPEIEALAPVASALESISPELNVIAMLERISAMAFHICASVLVFVSVRDPKRRGFFPLAILLHALLDFPAVLYQKGILGIYAVEALTFAFVLALSFFTVKLYRSLE